MSELITGADWQPDELDAIIADYFDMLSADLAGIPYVKTRHREGLVAQLGRSDGSIEFKHQNISDCSRRARISLDSRIQTCQKLSERYLRCD